MKKYWLRDRRRALSLQIAGGRKAYQMLRKVEMSLMDVDNDLFRIDAHTYASSQPELTISVAPQFGKSPSDEDFANLLVTLGDAIPLPRNPGWQKKVSQYSVGLYVENKGELLQAPVRVTVLSYPIPEDCEITTVDELEPAVPAYNREVKKLVCKDSQEVLA